MVLINACGDTGGYHRWKCLQCPVKYESVQSKVALTVFSLSPMSGARSNMLRISAHQIAWSKWVESVRKDVECVFGRMKARF